MNHIDIFPVTNEIKKINETNESVETLNDQSLASEPQIPNEDKAFINNSKKIDNDKLTKDREHSNKNGKEDICNKFRASSLETCVRLKVHWVMDENCAKPRQ